MSVTINGNGAISGLVIATNDLDNGAVTLGKMANMATASVLGRNTAGTGAPEVLSAATTRTLIGADNASNLTSGTVSTARLASGTADNTTYLRGDSTWQAISVTPTTAQVLSATAGASVGAVGTYAFMMATAAIDASPGATRAGSGLYFAAVTDITPSGGTGSGTWRLMGWSRSGVGSTGYTSVWLRIS